MKLRTDDINFVIGTFIEKSKNKSNSFYQLINTNRIGVAGHSLVGFAALELRDNGRMLKRCLRWNLPICTILSELTEKNLTDLVKTSPILCALLGGGFKKSGYNTLEIINQKSLAFFDEYLR